MELIKNGSASQKAKAANIKKVCKLYEEMKGDCPKTYLYFRIGERVGLSPTTVRNYLIEGGAIEK